MWIVVTAPKLVKQIQMSFSQILQRGKGKDKRNFFEQL